jgi:hypothetical protein
MGILLLKTPYTNHKRVPRVNSAYIDREMLVVSFVRMVLMAWGKKEKVVQAAARRPIMVINDTY